MKKILLIFLVGSIFQCSYGQTSKQINIDSLKQQVMSLQADVDYIKLNLNKSKKRFNQGMIVATIGYTVTIAGGLILSENQDLGKGLLYTGGAIGVAGTAILLNGFKIIGLAGSKTRPVPTD